MSLKNIKKIITLMAFALGLGFLGFNAQVSAQETSQTNPDAAEILKKTQQVFATKKIFKISCSVENSKSVYITYNLDKKVALAEVNGKKEYLDFKNKLIYTYNSSLKRYEVEPIPSSELEYPSDFSSVYSFDSTLYKMLLNIDTKSTYAGEETITLDGKKIDCYKINTEADLSNILSNQTNSNIMGANMGMTIKSTGIIYIGKSDYNVYTSNSSLEIGFLGYAETVNLKVDFTYPTSFDLPAACSKAQLAKGYLFTKSGITYKVALKKKNAVLTVTSTGSKKTVSIPKTIKKYGKSYKVTKVNKSVFKNNKKVKKISLAKNISSLSKNTFKGAKKLKKLKISNKKLRKKVKKNLKKYGLTKKVKIS